MRCRPDVLDSGRPRGDQVSSVNAVMHGPFGESDGKRWTPSQNPLHQSIDVRQVVFVGEIREYSFADDPVQFLLRFFHHFGIKNLH